MLKNCQSSPLRWLLAFGFSMFGVALLHASWQALVQREQDAIDRRAARQNRQILEHVEYHTQLQRQRDAQALADNPQVIAGTVRIR